MEASWPPERYWRSFNWLNAVSRRAGDAIARVANRIGSEQSRKTGKMQGFVGIRMMSRLGLEGSSQIVDGLAAVADGFYQGSTQALDKVELVL